MYQKELIPPLVCLVRYLFTDLSHFKHKQCMSQCSICYVTQTHCKERNRCTSKRTKSTPFPKCITIVPICPLFNTMCNLQELLPSTRQSQNKAIPLAQFITNWTKNSTLKSNVFHHRELHYGQITKNNRIMMLQFRGRGFGGGVVPQKLVNCKTENADRCMDEVEFKLTMIFKKWNDMKMIILASLQVCQRSSLWCNLSNCK